MKFNLGNFLTFGDNLYFNKIQTHDPASYPVCYTAI